MREGGPVENATVFCYGVALVCVWRAHGFSRTSAAAGILLFACVAKEISLRRWLAAAAGYDPCCFDPSAWPNLLAFAAAGATLVSAIWLLWRYGRTFLRGLRSRRAFAVTLLVALVCIAVAELMDQLPKLYGDAADAAPFAHARRVAWSLEEVLEMTFPVLVALAMLQLRVENLRQGSSSTLTSTERL